MNAVEIADAVGELAEQPFDAEEFPFAFLAAFGNKDATLKRLRSGESNKTDVPGAVLQRNNIHLSTCAPGEVSATLAALRASPAAAKAKAKFALATDGADIEAENLVTGETLACTYAELGDKFGFFLPLAGINTVRQISENAFDIKATGRLNKLYVELAKENPDWGAADRRHDLNHFFARLIFCFFAEDTDIFNGDDLFTATITQMSERNSSNTHEVIGELFRAMDTPLDKRAAAGIKPWADVFPYVNGGLFAGAKGVPRFSRIARTYLLHIGNLDWTKINPDIFGSMIQAVAEDEERGALGMHYTSLPNILKVLNPLFLDDLREKLEEAGDNPRKLFNLRNRLSRIRVFDPACGSGNFLVIAYKEMRAIEAEINRRRRETGRKSVIPLTNFRGIEIRDFPAEIARLALVIAEYQCDVLYRGQKEALAEFLPLDAMNWITCGNALRLDWLSLCPPTGTGVKRRAEDLFGSELEQPEIDFENEGGETYICGNPPYVGFTWQTLEQKKDIENLFSGNFKGWKSLDYVTGWFLKSARYLLNTKGQAALVSTNSICQGEQVPIFWPYILNQGLEIKFAYSSFRWTNLAANNAGVSVIIVSIGKIDPYKKKIFLEDEYGEITIRIAANINAYLVAAEEIFVNPIFRSPDDRALMVWGNKPTDGGNLVVSPEDRRDLLNRYPEAKSFLRPYLGAAEAIQGKERFCLWISDDETEDAAKIPPVAERIEAVRSFRQASKAAETRPAAAYPHRFRQIQNTASIHSMIIPQVSSERRPFLPVRLLPREAIISNLAFAIYDAPLWNLALIASRLHLVWIATVCGKLKTDFRYSNTLGWNTFPVPKLTERNKADLAACAEGILLAREAHFPATIAELYDPEKMPANLRAAHERNDETLERIYIGRRFRNDTERLETLFELYTRMTAAEAKAPKAKRRALA